MSRFKDIVATGKRFSAFVKEGLESEKLSAAGFAKKARRTGTFSASTLARLDQIEGSYHLLVAAEIWCPDCHINLAVMDFMCEAQPNIELAIVSKGRAENDLQESLGLERILVPVVAVLNEAYELIGTFVERPKVVQNDTTGQAMLRYRAGDHMDDTLQDLLTLMEQNERVHPVRASGTLPG
ncbi:TPA: thioredoxin family protein [Pseudomonas aeruginosa]|uniref:thioredoxin family protein n=1 Tax=Pseudomonas aeruginosa TaxID=287 RepID=UPI000F52C0A6|nr:thioredoxin family protein [Pseudomonas aeruginosa]HEM7588800.1 thioredoxin family protein [Serratia marcescens]EKV4129857.1 thioredoxin family protein [Pseudomonas aeruginosa]EKV4132325.1 thioredoxin family protein [Pseudomonas aeruginosa]EKW1534499.1 thioredoxin family protein [Pseudomonas aeruginosa]EKW1536632.1 thioredoxin family protein [Pseudomonas aeruginosa]